MSRYAFFGGSFNPPTKAHMNLAEQVIKEFHIDKFFFVPVGNFFPKQGLLEEKIRYEMLQIACREREKMQVSSIELNRKQNLKAIDIFREIKNKYPLDQIYYVMGADNFENMINWKESKELIENYQFILLNRMGKSITKTIEKWPTLQKNQSHFHILSSSCISSISSTEVREDIKQENWERVKDKVIPSVVNYIYEKKLYQNRQEG